MTDEVQQQAQGDQTQAAGIQANQPAAGVVVEGGDPNVTTAAQPTVEEVAADRQAKALETAKAGGYVEPPEPSITERVNALVAGVQHAMDHNAPMTREHFEEMKALLGHREETAA